MLRYKIFVLSLWVILISPCLSCGQESEITPSASIVVDQRTEKDIPDFNGQLRIMVGDIHHNVVPVSLVDKEGKAILDNVTFKIEDEKEFSFSDKKYVMRLEKIDDKLVGVDSAKFSISLKVEPANGAHTENAEIADATENTAAAPDVSKNLESKVDNEKIAEAGKGLDPSKYPEGAVKLIGKVSTTTEAATYPHLYVPDVSGQSYLVAGEKWQEINALGYYAEIEVIGIVRKRINIHTTYSEINVLGYRVIKKGIIDNEESLPEKPLPKNENTGLNNRIDKNSQSAKGDVSSGALEKDKQGETRNEEQKSMK